MSQVRHKSLNESSSNDEEIFLSEKVVIDCIMALTKRKSPSEGCLRQLLIEAPSDEIAFCPEKFHACCKRLSQDVNIDPTVLSTNDDAANDQPLLSEAELIELFNHLTTEKKYQKHQHPTAQERRACYRRGEDKYRKRSAINYAEYAKQQEALKCTNISNSDVDLSTSATPTDLTRVRRFSITKKGLRRRGTIYASRSYPSSLNVNSDSNKLTQPQFMIPEVQTKTVSSVDLRVNGVSILESKPQRLTRSTCDLYQTRQGEPVTLPNLKLTIPISYHRIAVQGEAVVGKTTLIQIFVEGHGKYIDIEDSMGKYYEASCM